MKKQNKIQPHHFPVLYQQDEDGFYVAKVPTLPGCHTQAKTLELAEKRIKQAIKAYLESLEIDNKHIPYNDEKIFLGSVTV